MLFAEGEVINEVGLDHLKVYLVSLAGFNKSPWIEKIIKFDENFSEYISFLQDLLENKNNNNIATWKNFHEFIDKFKINELSEPFQFLSIFMTCLNISQGNNVVFNPILLNASCSGIQHISSLTLNKDLASNVNVYTESLNINDENPVDFYSYAVILINTKLSNSDYPNIRNIKLNRKVIKRPAMALAYNVSLSGMGEQLKDFFIVTNILNNSFIKVPKELTNNNQELLLTFKEFGELTKIIYLVLTRELPGLNTLTNYFNKIIKLVVKLNRPVSWITPSGGVKIKYGNMKFESIKTKATLMGSYKPVTLSIPTAKKLLDKVKIRRSFSPNFIHSLYASLVHLFFIFLYDESIVNKNFMPAFTVHDCFATTPNNIDKMVEIVKQAFILIYFKDKGYLIKFHEHILNELNEMETYSIILKDNKYYLKMTWMNLKII